MAFPHFRGKQRESESSSLLIKTEKENGGELINWKQREQKDTYSKSDEIKKERERIKKGEYLKEKENKIEGIQIEKQTKESSHDTRDRESGNKGRS